MGDKAIDRGKGQTSSKRPHEYVSRAMDYVPGTRGNKARKAVSAMLPAPKPQPPTQTAKKPAQSTGSKVYTNVTDYAGNQSRKDKEREILEDPTRKKGKKPR